VFYALFQKAEAQNITLTSQYTPLEDNRFNFKMTGSTTVNTTVARVIGQTHIDINTSSEVIWGVKRLQLALALDNTGSMDNEAR
jgi:hypothetical protein